MRLSDAVAFPEKYKEEIILLMLSCSYTTSASFFYVNILDDWSREESLTPTLVALDSLCQENWMYYEHPFGWKLRKSSFNLQQIVDRFGDRLKLSEVELSLLKHLYNSTYNKEQNTFTYKTIKQKSQTLLEQDTLRGLLNLHSRGYIFENGNYEDSQRLTFKQSHWKVPEIRENIEFQLNKRNKLKEYSLYVSDNEFFEIKPDLALEWGYFPFNVKS